jgi:NodT family efflux transporter outer membrane factor (OMF) lipoprotein
MPRPLRLRLVLVVVGAMSGCSMVGPDFMRPKVQVPDQFSATASKATANVNGWWQALGDPLLADLQQAALDANPDVQAALQRLRVARAVSQGADARMFPTLNGSTGETRAKNAPVTPVTPITSTFNAQFDASWEADIWGGIRRNREAARAGIAVSEADLADVRLALVSEVAAQYANYRTAERNALYTRQTIDSRDVTRDIVRQRVRAGLTSGDELSRAESQYQLANASLAQTRQAGEAARLSLELLCGLQPGQLEPRMGQGSGPVTLPVPTGVLPAELLERRPDVRRAERQAAQAIANVGVAKSNRLPRLIFSGRFGATDVTPTTGWFNPFSLAVVLSGVIWDAGALAAQIEQRDAQAAELIQRYVQTVRSAVSEVEQRLTAIERGRERIAALERQAAADRETADIARERYRIGLTTFLDVADAERILFATELALNQARGTLATDTIALNKALGGEWPGR